MSDEPGCYSKHRPYTERTVRDTPLVGRGIRSSVQTTSKLNLSTRTSFHSRRSGGPGLAAERAAVIFTPVGQFLSDNRELGSPVGAIPVRNKPRRLHSAEGQGLDDSMRVPEIHPPGFRIAQDRKPLRHAGKHLLRKIDRGGLIVKISKPTI